MAKTRLLIVDDHALFRDGLASLIASQEDMEVVGEASQGLEALEKARELMPDIILMDVKMPQCDGLEATRLIKKEMPYVKIIMLTVHDDDENLFESIKSGAQGYLLKNITSQELLEAVRGMARGEAAISRPLAGRLLAEFGRLAQRESLAPGEEAELTSRERQVLELVAKGASNKEIARALVLSENTVKNHLRNILEKLHLNNRTQAAAYALKRGIIQPPLEPQGQNQG
jgi:DNA-binding NarL/FixJ family response regulator